MKGDARTLNAFGGITLFAGAAGTISAVIGGAPQDVIVPWMIAASGIVAVGANFLRLPRWADTRRKQMDFIAARAAAIMDGDPPATG
ncbi:MAG TPA: hypothetical protein VF584_19890 [Longimicrobium sp.]